MIMHKPTTGVNRQDRRTSRPLSRNGHGLIVLFFILAACFSCAGPTYKELVPSSPTAAPGRNFAGTVNVQSAITLSGDSIRYINVVTNDTLITALREAVSQRALFSLVNSGNADYVLDVWVEKLDNQAPAMGIGTYTADASSVWRLTRASDGKVILCDFVDGRGIITSGMAPRRQSLLAALRSMIENGLAALSDGSKEHLGARSLAGLRPSMGSVVPEGYAQWSANVKRNWPKLRMGLTFAEVEACIGPVKTSGALVKTYSQGYTEEYDTGLYTVVFLNGKLSRWELRGGSQ